MPRYDYGCNACQQVFEISRSIKDDAPVSCPRCQSGETMRLFLSAPTISSRNSTSADSPLDNIPDADKMRQAADRTVNKVMKDMGMS